MTWQILREKVLGRKASVDLSTVGLLKDEEPTEEIIRPMTNNNNNNNNEKIIKKCTFPIRVLVALLAGFGVFNANTLRLNLSIAIVAMVNTSAILIPTNSTTDVCRNPAAKVLTTDTPLHEDRDGPFLWDETTRGIILSCYFWGNVFGQIPGGMIADRFGGKWPFGIGIFISALVSILLPAAAYYDVKLLIALRVLCGLSQGMAIPAMFSLLAKWVPHEERSRLIGLTFGGVSLGKVVVFPVSAFLCEQTFLDGWPAVFYVFGGLAVLWFVLWSFLVYDKPSSDPKVGVTELLYLQDNVQSRPRTVKLHIHWCVIARSSHFWAMILAYFAHAWGAHTLLTILPTYLKFAMDFDMNASGLVNGLPYILAFFTGLFSSWIADMLQNSQKFSRTTIRKMFAAVSMFIPMGCLIGVTFLHCDRLGLIILLSLSVAVANMNAGGLFLNEMDLSLPAAGTLKALTNLASNIAGVSAPYFAGLLVNNDESISEWNRVFYLAAGILFVGITAFLVFGTAEAQPFTYETEVIINNSSEDDDAKIPILTENNNHQRYLEDSIKSLA